MKKEKSRSNFGMLWEFLRGSKKFFVISILASFGITLIDMVTPQIIRNTVDSVLGTEEWDLPAWIVSLLESWGGAAYFRSHMGLIALLILVTAVIASLLRYINNLYNTKGSETLVETMRNRLFAHIQRLPFAWHMQNKTGDIIQRCTSDVDMVRNFITEQLIGIIRIVILLALSLTFMFSMNVKLTLIAIITMPIIITYSIIFHSKIGKEFEKCDENEGILSTIAQENLTGVRVVRAFGRERYERDRFEKQNVYYTGLWVRLMRLLAMFWGMGDLISGLQVMMIVVFGSIFCVRGEMTAGDFIAFVSYNSMMMWPVRSLGRMISEMSKAGVAISRIRYIIDSPIEEDDPNGLTPDMHQDITFKNVSFAYEGASDTLHDVSFTIPAGSTFGILGGTGSGKSTLIALLNRLYELPEKSSITVGGTDIRSIRLSYLRANVGMVLQEPFLFSRTIRENIGITQEEPDMKAIRAAASVAAVDKAITEFAHGYETMVGERGVTLSGGQKQRTAMARTLLEKTPIMIFDDSLSAVDAETDQRIRASLRENLGNTTTVLISHRINTLKSCDKILVLDKGRVAEIGTHEELCARKGIYYKIYTMQLAAPPEEVKSNA